MRATVGHEICGAKRRDGGKCKGKAMANGRCRVHGGNARSGIAHPNYKTGSRSKYLTALPQRIAKDFEQLRGRDDLLRLNDDIALIDARIVDVIRQVDKGEAGALWLKLQKAFAEFKEAYDGVEGSQADEKLRKLDQIIKNGATDWQAWGEVKSLVEQRRRLVESERKREVEQQEILTGREAAMLFNALLAIINEHVTDRNTKQRIQTDVTRLVAGEVRGGLKLVG